MLSPSVHQYSCNFGTRVPGTRYDGNEATKKGNSLLGVHVPKPDAGVPRPGLVAPPHALQPPRVSPVPLAAVAESAHLGTTTAEETYIHMIHTPRKKENKKKKEKNEKRKKKRKKTGVNTRQKEKTRNRKKKHNLMYMCTVYVYTMAIYNSDGGGPGSISHHHYYYCYHYNYPYASSINSARGRIHDTGIWHLLPAPARQQKLQSYTGQESISPERSRSLHQTIKDWKKKNEPPFLNPFK